MAQEEARRCKKSARTLLFHQIENIENFETRPFLFFSLHVWINSI
jgi:hypothetical protein